VVSMFTMGPMGLAAAGFSPAKVSGFLWVIKIVVHTFFRGEVKPLFPCRRFTAWERTQQSMSEVLCQPNFPTPVSHVGFCCFSTRWLWLLNQDYSIAYVGAAG
jgi:hypothetical protein